jgi:hypothetical protein
MAGGDPSQIGQLSPDGAWRWDGQRWVPTGAGMPVQGARRSRRWLWWVAGGCALILVLAGVGGVWAVTSLVRSFQSGSLSCLPSDFPRYPGATVTRDYTYFGTNVAPGDSKECQETLTSDDDVAAVTAFYASHLDSGDWKVTKSDNANGQISFTRRSKTQNVGVIQLLGRGQHTVIEIKFDS